MTKLRILIADDHALVRMGISALLSAQRDMTVVGQAKNGAEAVREEDLLKALGYRRLDDEKSSFWV